MHPVYALEQTRFPIVMIKLEAPITIYRTKVSLDTLVYLCSTLASEGAIQRCLRDSCEGVGRYLRPMDSRIRFWPNCVLAPDELVGCGSKSMEPLMSRPGETETRYR